MATRQIFMKTTGHDCVMASALSKNKLKLNIDAYDQGYTIFFL